MNSASLVARLPPMLTQSELITAMQVLPDYNREAVYRASVAERLVALSDLYQIYVPSQMSLEIYSKLYLALMRSMQKKDTKLAVKQYYQNLKLMRQQEYRGIMGGSDSFTIIGTSGIGKSSAIERAINLMNGGEIITNDAGTMKVIPCVIVQCPFDSSVKGLLLEILRKVDDVLGSKYYHNALRARATTDMLIGSVSQVAISHIGMLVVDEIQNVANSKNGKSLIGSLTQLINNSGISICMVGTPESTKFFESAMQLARRSVGLQYSALDYNEYFQTFCQVLFQYQYTRQSVELTEGIVQWLYEHSAGVTAVAVALIHDAQEIAILNKTEILDIQALNEAYQQRMTLLHGYINAGETQSKQTRTRKKLPDFPMDEHGIAGTEDAKTLSQLVQDAKADQMDIVQALKGYVVVEEVAI